MELETLEFTIDSPSQETNSTPTIMKEINQIKNLLLYKNFIVIDGSYSTGKT